MIRVYLANFWLVFVIFLYFPMLIILFRNPINNKIVGAIYYWGARLITGIRVKVKGRENIPEKACVYVFNHQSSLDGMAMGKLGLRRAAVLGKKELLYVPFFGWGFWLAGNIFLDRGKGRENTKRVDAAVQAIVKRNVSICIFPEGTRNHETDDLLPFKKGGFVIAEKAGASVVPVVIQSFKKVYDKSKRMVKSGEITVSVLPAISSAELKGAKLAEAVRSRMIAEFQALSQ